MPVRLGEVAGDVIAEQLELFKHRRWNPLPDQPESFRVVYVQSHVRTRQWYKDGETFIWENDAPDNPSYAAPKTKRKTSILKK